MLMKSSVTWAKRQRCRNIVIDWSEIVVNCHYVLFRPFPAVLFRPLPNLSSICACFGRDFSADFRCGSLAQIYCWYCLVDLQQKALDKNIPPPIYPTKIPHQQSKPKTHLPTKIPPNSVGKKASGYVRALGCGETLQRQGFPVGGCVLDICSYNLHPGEGMVLS